MRHQYVQDWIPARRVADDRATVPSGPGIRGFGRGVGFTAVRVSSRAPLKGEKSKVRPLSLPAVRNGPLSQRAEKTKTALRQGQGVRGMGQGVGIYYVNGLGVRGSASQAMYAQAITQAKQQVVDAVTSTQAALDKIDSTLIGTDTQVQSLRDAAGPSAPSDVLAVVDGASEARRGFGDMVDSLKATIDSMNAAAQAVPAQAGIGNFGVGTPGQVALDKARQGVGALVAQVGVLQRAGSQLAQKVEAATQAVNRYVDGVNAQAALEVKKQRDEATTTDVVYQLTDQQKALEAAKANQAQSLADAQAARDARYAQDQADRQAQYDAQLAKVKADYEAQRNAQLAQQQQYVPPSDPPYRTPQNDPSQGGAAYAPQYTQQPGPPPAALTPERGGAYSVPSQGYDPVQYQDDSVQTYQTPQSGGNGDDQGFPDADASYGGGQVDGYRRETRGVGAQPSSGAMATAAARDILAQANLKVAAARKEIERRRLEAEAVLKRQQGAPASGGSMAFWKKAGLVLGAGFAAVGIADTVFRGGKKHK